MPGDKSEAGSCGGGISGRGWETLSETILDGLPVAFPPVRRRMEPKPFKTIRLCPEAAACSFRCTIPRKSQEVIKWKRSENEEVLVPLPWDGAAMPWLGSVSPECPRCSKARLIYSSELEHSCQVFASGTAPPEDFLTSWVKWHTCGAAVVLSGTAKCGVISHRYVCPV